MNRDEYLQKANEGFIKDTIKKGWKKVKSFFKFGFKKIKNFLAVIDNNGNVLPVVSLQATIDRTADLDCVDVYAPSLISDLAVEAGGKGCEEKATIKDNGEIYNYGPDGREAYIKWLKDKKFKDEPEYKNMITLTKMIAESAGASKEDVQKLFESWEGVKDSRISLTDDEALEGAAIIRADEFSDILNKKVQQWSVRRGATRVKVVNGVKREGKVMGNILVFGAPGIGKSTVPQAVVDAYNKNITDKENMISFININCANIKPGDFMMPTMPREINIMQEIENFKDSFPQASAALAELNDEQKNQIANIMYQSNQFKATDAPKSWLPSYRKTGNDILDKILNDAANGGEYDKDGESVKTGGGGIILFDEFLRCDPDVFGELMNFLNDRQLNGWILGDRWTIIACSNRPCDDGAIAGVWSEWYAAHRDRWDKMYQFIPTEKEWEKWARSKGCDELILDFIFENSDDSKVGSEYARWHSAVYQGAGDSNQVKPITPREWERVFTQLIDYEIEHDYDDMSEMTEEEIYKEIKGSFPEDFTRVFLDWIHNRLDAKNVDLDLILTDPKSVKLAAKFINDPSASLALINVLYTKFSERFKDNPEDCSDEELTNLYKWLGINYKDDYVTVYGFADKLAHNIFKDNTKNRIDKKIKAMQTIISAFPLHGLKDDIEYAEHNEDEEARWPEGSFEILKDIMREDFPWRIDGDNIKYYDEFDMDAVKDYSAKIHEIQLDDEK